MATTDYESVPAVERDDAARHLGTVVMKFGGTSVADPDRMRDSLTSAVLNSLNSVLAEPIQDVLLEDSSGRLCIETKTTVDLERALCMTAGNIFHGALRWPFAEDDDERARPRPCTSASRSQSGGASSGRRGRLGRPQSLTTQVIAY